MSTTPTGWLGERSLDGGIDRIPLPAPVPGALWLCGKHAIAPHPERALARVGATTAVCLNERDELLGRYPGYVAWLDEAVAAGRAVWFPIPDLHYPPLAPAKALVGELCTRLDGGETLLVHCGAGIGRAGTTAVAVLITLGIDPVAALATVRTHRPMAGPEAGAQRALIDALAAEFGS